MEDMTKQKARDVSRAGYAEAAEEDVKEAALNITIKKLVCALLSCGERNLETLGRVRYSWEDVLARITWEDTERLRYEDLMWAVVDVGVASIKNALTERILGLSSRWQEDALDGHGLDEDEKEELMCLSLLDPEHDIFSCYDHQEQGMHTWFGGGCEKIYRRYFPDVLEAFEKDTGIKIEHRCG